MAPNTAVSMEMRPVFPWRDLRFHV